MLDALFIWSGLHGLSSIHASPALKTLQLKEDVLEASPEHLLFRFGEMLG